MTTNENAVGITLPSEMASPYANAGCQMTTTQMVTTIKTLEQQLRERTAEVEVLRLGSNANFVSMQQEAALKVKARAERDTLQARLDALEGQEPVVYRLEIFAGDIRYAATPHVVDETGIRMTDLSLWEPLYLSAPPAPQVQATEPDWAQVDETGYGQENHCDACGAEPGQSCSSIDGAEWGRKVHKVRQSAPPNVQAVTPGHVLVPVEPTEAMWGGLARDIVFWLYMNSGPHYGSKMHEHLRNLGTEIPDWLTKEIPDAGHTPPKGTVAVCIYKAMIAAAPQAGTKGGE